MAACRLCPSLAGSWLTNTTLADTPDVRTMSPEVHTSMPLQSKRSQLCPALDLAMRSVQHVLPGHAAIKTEQHQPEVTE